MRAKVDELIRGMVLLKVEDEGAWVTMLEWTDVDTLGKRHRLSLPSCFPVIDFVLQRDTTSNFYTTTSSSSPSHPSQHSSPASSSTLASPGPTPKRRNERGGRNGGRRRGRGRGRGVRLMTRWRGGGRRRRMPRRERGGRVSGIGIRLRCSWCVALQLMDGTRC